MSGVKGRSGPPGNKNRRTHGLNSYRKVLEGTVQLTPDMDLRSVLREKEEELAIALGGDPSPQEKILIADTVRSLFYVGTLDTYLANLKHLVNKGKAHGVLITRTEIAGHMRKNLQLLGLKRVAKTVTLDEVLNGNNQDT